MSGELLDGVGEFGRFDERMKELARHIRQAAEDVDRIQTTGGKISQQFQSAQLAAHGHLDYWPKGWCVSFKNDCVPRHIKSYRADPALPAGAKIVVFAGNPKMGEVLAGGGHRLHRRIGNVDWLRHAWEA